MGWLLLGIAVAAASLVLLAVVVLSLWRRTKALMRTVGNAGEVIAARTEALAQLQSAAPRGGSAAVVDTRTTPAGSRQLGARRPRGVA